MHIGDTPEEAAFRAEARAWLDQQASRRESGDAQVAAPAGGLAAHIQRCRDWQRVLADHGWAGITWPTEYGGRGASSIQAAIFGEEQANYDVSVGAFAVSIGMVGPTLIAHGSPEQKERHLARILRGDEVWCQLFSEPGAGSDLAALATRAELHGDHYVVNGQKVWTSFGQFAEYGILLARTDPSVRKHAGITYFIVDMSSPGIEVRPITQITGIKHFNETFLTDVRIPVENIVGEVNGGWAVAQTTLTSERGVIGSGGGWTVAQLIDLAQRYGKADDPAVRQSLVKAHCREETMKYMRYRMRTAMSQRKMPGLEMLVLKLAVAQHWARSGDVAMQILGAAGTLAGEDAAENDAWGQQFLGQYSIRIGGGTDEIQHNIIAERGLGLPREPDPDKGLPWQALTRA